MTRDRSETYGPVNTNWFHSTKEKDLEICLVAVACSLLNIVFSSYLLSEALSRATMTPGVPESQSLDPLGLSYSIRLPGPAPDPFLPLLSALPIYLRCSSRDDHVTWGLNPGLTIHLHWSSLEECDTEVGALGNADSRAQPTLYLALGKRKVERASRTQGIPQGLPTSLLLLLTMCTTPVTPTTSNSPSSIRGFSNLESLSEPHRSAPEPQLPPKDEITKLGTDQTQT